MNPSFRIMNGDQKRAQTWSRIKKGTPFPNEAPQKNVIKDFKYNNIISCIFERGMVTAFPNEAT